MSNNWDDLSHEIVELVKENLVTPDQMVPYAELLFSSLLDEIRNKFGDNINLDRQDDKNVVQITNTYNNNRIDLSYYPLFYFDEDPIILSYNNQATGESNYLRVSEGIEVFNSFREDIMADIESGSLSGESSELIDKFLYLNNFLPETLRTDDPYKLIEVVRVLLDGSNRIRKVTEK